MASGERAPAGRIDATNYLVDSVNWSHSDWANLGTVPFVSEMCVFRIGFRGLHGIRGEQ